jgi:hypothetical protein
MTIEEIGDSVINQVIYINGQWKASVSYNSKRYIVRFAGASNLDSTTLSDKIYDELLTTDKRSTPQAQTMVRKNDMVGTTPTNR